MSELDRRLTDASDALTLRPPTDAPPFATVLQRRRRRRVLIAGCGATALVVLVGALVASRDVDNDRRVVTTGPDQTATVVVSTSTPAAPVITGSTTVPASTTTSIGPAPISGVTPATSTTTDAESVCGDPATATRTVLSAWSSGLPVERAGLPDACVDPESTGHRTLWFNEPFDVGPVTCDRKYPGQPLCTAANPDGRMVIVQLVSRVVDTSTLYFFYWVQITQPEAWCTGSVSKLFSAWHEGRLDEFDQRCAPDAVLDTLRGTPVFTPTYKGCGPSEIVGGVTACYEASSDTMVMMFSSDADSTVETVGVGGVCSASYSDLAATIFSAWRSGNDAPDLGGCMPGPLPAPHPVPSSAVIDCNPERPTERDNGGHSCMIIVDEGTIRLGIHGAFQLADRIFATFSPAEPSTSGSTTSAAPSTTSTAVATTPAPAPATSTP